MSYRERVNLAKQYRDEKIPFGCRIELFHNWSPWSEPRKVEMPGWQLFREYQTRVCYRCRVTETRAL